MTVGFEVQFLGYGTFWQAVRLVFSRRTLFSCSYMYLLNSKTSKFESDVYWTVHHCDNRRIRNQLGAIIILLYLLYAQHVSAITMPIIRSSRLWCWLPHWSFRSWFAVGWKLGAVRLFIVLLIGSTCFGHYYAHHQKLATMMLITTLVVSFLVCCMLDVRCG